MKIYHNYHASTNHKVLHKVEHLLARYAKNTYSTFIDWKIQTITTRKGQIFSLQTPFKYARNSFKIDPVKNSKLIHHKSHNQTHKNKYCMPAWKTWQSKKRIKTGIFHASIWSNTAFTNLKERIFRVQAREKERVRVMGIPPETWRSPSPESEVGGAEASFSFLLSLRKGYPS